MIKNLQDNKNLPYHDGSADGLCFSNSRTKKVSPSLQNIAKEIVREFGNNTSMKDVSISLANFDYNLERWARQGVLMMNTALTVEKGKPESHLMIWRPFIKCIIKALNIRQDIVWLALGNKALNLLPANPKPLHVVAVGHPSPLNTTSKFVGSGCFGTVNKKLLEIGRESIVWL